MTSYYVCPICGKDVSDRNWMTLGDGTVVHQACKPRASARTIARKRGKEAPMAATKKSTAAKPKPATKAASRSTTAKTTTAKSKATAPQPDAVIAQPKGKVKLTTDQVDVIVAKRQAGASHAQLQQETGLKGHIIREVLRANELVKVDTPERLQRAKYMVALWTGTLAEGAEKVADPGKKVAATG